MKEDITLDEIKAIDEIYHEIVFANQRGDNDIFKNRLSGATTIEISILEIIHKKPDVILREIVDILGLPNSTLTNAINRLEKRNFVRRVISQRDRRSFGLELTEEGKLAQKEHKESENILWQKILSPLEKQERSVFLGCLKKIINNFKEADQK